MAANKLIFKDAEKVRDAITESQKQEIAKLYNKWADEIGERAKYYKRKTTKSSVLSERQMRTLQKQLRETSKQVSKEIYDKIKNNMYIVSDATVKANSKWMKELGFDEKAINAAMSSVPDSVVRNIVTGNIYDSGWSLSQRIWSDNEQMLKDIYGVVAKGIAENAPMYDIAKNLEAYVRPNAKMPWNLQAKDGVKIFKKKIDYNAQRLARTLVQHSYQQSFIATTKDNPFITDYIWISNGSRVCPLCAERDGQHFAKNELPMDHPNGMCTMEPNVADNLTEQLTNWVNSPDGTYPELDKFASNFGYVPNKITTGKQFADKYGTSSGAKFNYWYTKLSDEAKTVAKELKEKSGLTWQQWYEQNIKVGTKTTKAIKSKASVFDKDEWMSTLQKQHEKEMLAMESRAFKSMSSSEIEGIRRYTGSSYQQINSYLRHTAAGKSHAEAIQLSRISDSQLEAMRQAIKGLKNATLEKDIVLRRGTDLGDLAGFMSGNFNENKRRLSNMSLQELQSKFEGTLGTYSGFTSTSSLYNRGFAGDVEMIIRAPKGTPASSVMSISQYGTEEGETLLNANTTIRIVKIEESDRHMGSRIRVFAEVVLG